MQTEGTTRRQLLEVLRRKGGSSITELSKDLGITEMGVRRHIQTLERDGLVESAMLRQPMGRPFYQYSLTEQADDLFPKSYHHLTLDLLNEIEEQSGGTEMVDKLFAGRRSKLEAKYRGRLQDKTLEEKVAELAAIQNAGGYMAEWEANEDGSYKLYERNCPVTQVAKRYRQACHCEQQLFSNLLEADVKRLECLVDGGNCCTYSIKPRGN